MTKLRDWLYVWCAWIVVAQIANVVWYSIGWPWWRALALFFFPIVGLSAHRLTGKMLRNGKLS